MALYIYAFVCTAITAGGFIAYFICRLKCHKMHYNKYSNPCHDRNCRFSEYCDKYQHILTPEEKERLEKLIEKL